MILPLPKAEMERIAAPYQTISDKTRALTDAGYSIGQISKLLDRSYQQIRQVVKGYEARKKREGLAESAPWNAPSQTVKESVPTPSGASAIFRLFAAEDGILILPRHALESANIGPGEMVLGVVEQGQLVLTSAQAAMDRAQDLVQALLPGDDSLAESLLADRRREVEQEQDDA